MDTIRLSSKTTVNRYRTYYGTSTHYLLCGQTAGSAVYQIVCHHPLLDKSVTMSIIQIQTHTRTHIHTSRAQVEDFLHHAGIEGVYELATPFAYRACLHLGCVARVSQGRIAALKGVRSGSGQAPGFELDDLELVTTVCRYTRRLIFTR